MYNIILKLKIIFIYFQILEEEEQFKVACTHVSRSQFSNDMSFYVNVFMRRKQ